MLSGALPALLLLFMTYLGCESPLWLVIRGDYLRAFGTLVQLRMERLLAAEEFCYIYFKCQTERLLARKEKPDLGKLQPHIIYTCQLYRLLLLARNRCACVAVIIIMSTQQPSSIK